MRSRPATAADVAGLFDEPVPMTIRARVLEQDGKPVAIAGYFLNGGKAVMFSDVKGAIPKMTIWREAKAMMAGLKLPAICVAECGSGAFLERLGWSLAGNSADGEVYTWQP